MKGQNSTAKTPAEYIQALAEPRKTQIAEIDAFIRKAVPKLEPIVHSGMLAYGPAHFKYASGREGDWFKIGLASNKQHISIYVCALNDKGYLAEQNAKLLGKVDCGKSCIRFKKFEDVNQAVLKRVLWEAEKLKLGV